MSTPADQISYGCICHGRYAPNGSVPATVSGDVSDAVKKDVYERFDIGAVVDPKFYEREETDAKVDKGPCELLNHGSIGTKADAYLGSSWQDYLKAIAAREMNWLQLRSLHPRPVSGYAVPGSFQSRSTHDDPGQHMDVYEKYLKVIPHLAPKDGNLTRSTLTHWDLGANNVFVQDGQITSVIDWQNTWALPLFFHALPPALVVYTGEKQVYLPDGFANLPEGEEKNTIERRVEKTILQWLFFNGTQNRNPVLNECFSRFRSLTVQQLINAAMNTWTKVLLRSGKAWPIYGGM